MSEVRDRLRARQSELLRSLVQGEAAPPGFDATRVELTASGLARKRLYETGHSLRRLQDLVPFEALFERFAADVPRAPTPRLDGYRFCGWLLAQGEAGRAWKLAVGVRLSLREGPDDAWPARWPRVFLSRRGAALYLPGRGVRWL